MEMGNTFFFFKPLAPFFPLVMKNSRSPKPTMEREAESKKTEKEQKRIEEISERKHVDLSDKCSHHMIRHKPLVLHTHTLCISLSKQTRSSTE